MEESSSLSTDKSLSTKQLTSWREQSGWTSYFEDLSSLDGTSLISDATSGAAWKFLQNKSTDPPKCSEQVEGVVNIPNKAAVKAIPEDDGSLEDTASSPVSFSIPQTEESHSAHDHKVYSRKSTDHGCSCRLVEKGS